MFARSSPVRGMLGSGILCVIGLIFLIAGIVLLIQRNGQPITPKYVQGCIVTDLVSADHSSHQLEVGQYGPHGCQDASHFAIGYQFNSSNLHPPFPATLDSKLLSVEIWYRPTLTNGTCDMDHHPCQIASVVAIRPYTLASTGVSGNGGVTPGTLYKINSFTVSGDLTQKNYDPRNATFRSAPGSLWYPVAFLGAGLVVFAGGLFLLWDYLRSRREPDNAGVQEQYASHNA